MKLRGAGLKLFHPYQGQYQRLTGEARPNRVIESENYAPPGINNQTSSIWPYAAASFSYDPWGKRVMQYGDPDPNNWNNSSNPTWRYNFCGVTGQRLATVLCTPNPPSQLPYCVISGQNAYFGRRLLVSNGVTVVTDRLGTVRGNMQGEQMAYFPYGEERTSTVNDQRSLPPCKD